MIIMSCKTHAGNYILHLYTYTCLAAAALGKYLEAVATQSPDNQRSAAPVQRPLWTPLWRQREPGGSEFKL